MADYVPNTVYTAAKLQQDLDAAVKADDNEEFFIAIGKSIVYGVPITTPEFTPRKAEQFVAEWLAKEDPYVEFCQDLSRKLFMGHLSLHTTPKDMEKLLVEVLNICFNLWVCTHAMSAVLKKPSNWAIAYSCLVARIMLPLIDQVTHVCNVVTIPWFAEHRQGLVVAAPWFLGTHLAEMHKIVVKNKTAGFVSSIAQYFQTQVATNS